MIPYYETRPSEIFAFTSGSPDFPPHLHMHLELFFIIKGEIQVTVDGLTQTLSKGDLAVIFPNCVHGRAIAKSNSKVSVAVIAVTPQLTGDFNKIILNFCPENPFLSYCSVSSEIEHAVHRLLDLRDDLNKYEYADILIKSFMQIILGLAIPRLTLEKEPRPEYYLIQKTVTYLLKHFAEPITLESVAEHIGTSKHHLSSAFSRKMQTGFNKYLNNVRLNCARDLLRNTEYSITQIAYDCGFGTLRTFDRVFEKNCQMTPSEFRNIHNKKLEDTE